MQFQIKAKEITFLKKEPKQASSLAFHQKMAVPLNRPYGVEAILQERGQEVQIKLASGAGIWWVFKPHWDGWKEEVKDILLHVPYYSQRDNKIDWWRTCSTSSHAMILNYLKPGSVKSDDEYYHLYVRAFGDTTDWNVHTKALAQFGIRSEYRQNLDKQDLIDSLRKRLPVAIGVLHKGDIANPSGGHVLVIVGVEDDGNTFIANDPWGKPFDYLNTNGKQVKIPWNPSLERRWTADGDNTGWGRIITYIK